MTPFEILLDQENVLIDDDGSPVLADFGLSRYNDQPTLFPGERTRAPGSDRYMAPEYFTHIFSVTTQGDIWAYGMVVYVKCFPTLPVYALSDNSTGTAQSTKAISSLEWRCKSFVCHFEWQAPDIS